MHKQEHRRLRAGERTIKSYIFASYFYEAVGEAVAERVDELITFTFRFACSFIYLGCAFGSPVSLAYFDERVKISLVLIVACFSSLPSSRSIYRHHVFAFQMYPVGMSDMRLIDTKVSTTWCQRQLVKSNSTFNAFLMPETPKVASERQPVSMTR